MAKKTGHGEKVKSMKSWIWDAACSIRGAADAAKYKDYIMPLIFVKRLAMCSMMRLIVLRRK